MNTPEGERPTRILGVAELSGILNEAKRGVERLYPFVARVAGMQDRIDRVYASHEGLRVDLAVANCKIANEVELIVLLRSQLSTQTERIATLEAAVRWALGEEGDFPSLPEPVPGKPIRRYYWRGALRAKAFPESPT